MSPRDRDDQGQAQGRVPTLQTERLVLRPITLDDAPAIQRHFDNWEVIRHLSKAVPWPYPPDGALSFIRDVAIPGEAEGTKVCWAIAEKANPAEAIGILDYRPRDERDNRGFWIAAPYQGRGYITEAVTAFQDYVFFDLGVERIFVCNCVDNPRSRRVKEKTGARLLGLIEVEHHSGETRTERWEVTRAAWAALRGR